MDDVMISAFLDTNYVGEDGMTAVPFKESQQIAVDHVDSGTKGASNLTVAKLRAALQLFEENEAWNQDAPQFGDQLVIAVTSSQIMSLLRETEVSSYDFNNVKALVEGKIDTFMGFKFIRTQRLPKAEDGHPFLPGLGEEQGAVRHLERLQGEAFRTRRLEEPSRSAPSSPAAPPVSRKKASSKSCATKGPTRPHAPLTPSLHP